MNKLNKKMSPVGLQLWKKRQLRIAAGWTPNAKGFIVNPPPKQNKGQENESI